MIHFGGISRLNLHRERVAFLILVKGKTLQMTAGEQDKQRK